MRFFAFAFALLALALSMWIVVPGPVLPLFILGVGGTEFWPFLALADSAVLALNVARRERFRPAGILTAAVALACTLVPPAAYFARGPYVPAAAFFAPMPSRLADVRVANDAPIVLTIYGGAWQRGSPRNDSALNATIASWGYRVIPLDYPHAPAARWPAQRDAVLRQIDELRGARAAILGHSSGAQLAIIAAALRPHAISAVVTYESPVDLRLGYEYPAQPDIINARKIMSDLCGGTPRERPSCYRDASPRYAVRTGMPPIMMIAAARDHVVDVRFERVLRDTLRADGVSVDYVELPWADHAFETIAGGFDDRIALFYLRQFLRKHARR